MTERPSSAYADRLRSAVNRVPIELRTKVLEGGYFLETPAGENATVIHPSQWETPSFRLDVFLSSTFTDTTVERDYLMDELQFELRKIGREYGIAVRLMDMRSGIKDESTLEHLTWIECRKGIEECKLRSMGMMFFSLQGNKYGYTPLQKDVLQSDLEQHILNQDLPEDVKQLIFEWYTLNMNTNPPEYTLKPLTSLNDAAYWAAYEKLLPALSGLPFDTKNYTGLQVGMSVTECEVRGALASYPIEVDNKSKQLCWSFRNLAGDIPEPNFCDTQQNNAKVNAYKQLIAYMKEQFPESCVQEYATDLTLPDLKNQTTKQVEYLQTFKRFAKDKLTESLSKIVGSYEDWTKTGGGLDIEGAEASEMLRHCKFAYLKCSSFVGREALVDETIALIEAPNRILEDETIQSDPFNPVHRFLGIAVAMIGVSGAGKTALMSKVASEMYKRGEGKSKVVIRFCGTSPKSKNARNVLMSICRQMEFLFDVQEKMSSFFQDLPYDQLVYYFQDLVHKHPVLLFIDSLDQLTDENQGRSQISFLKGVRPHPDTRIVVSCLPDEPEVDPSSGRSYMYYCETRLQAGNVPRVVVQMSKDRVLEESMEMVDQLLEKQGRRLQDEQRIVVQQKISDEKHKTALYIHLAVGVMSKWTSDVDADTSLKGGVIALIEQLYVTLEYQFGKELVRAALAILTFSVRGVSDIEMEDLLSLHDPVLDKVFQYVTPTVRRLPSHVWQRIKTAMDGLITEGEHGCVRWFHRQLRETAERWFASEKAMVHSLMAKYFGNLVEEKVRAERKIVEQQWTIQGHPFDKTSVVNVRRCVEASHHMFQCGHWAEAVSELCNFEGICCKIRIGEGFQLVLDLAEIVDKIPTNVKLQQRAYHYLRWLRQDLHELFRDCISQFTFSATSQPRISHVGNDACVLLEQYRLRGLPCAFTRGKLLGRSFVKFSSQLSKFRGHSRSVSSVSFSPDGKSVVSGSQDTTIRIWDVASGAEVGRMEGHGGYVTSVSFSPDGKSVVSGSSDKTIKIWDVASGTETRTMAKHSSELSCVVFNSDGKTVVSGSHDMTIRIWDVATGVETGKMEGHSDKVISVSFSPDGKSVVSGSKDKTIRIWDLASGAETKKLEGHGRSVSSVAFSPDGKSVVSGSSDKTIRIWDVASGKETGKKEGHEGKVSSVTFSPDGKSVVSGSSDNTVRVWDMISGAEARIREGHIYAVSSVSFSPDGKNVVSGSWDTTIIIWDVASQSDTGKMAVHGNTVSSVSFSPNGRSAVSGSFDTTIRIWDVTSGAETKKLEGHTGGVSSVSFSPDAKSVVSGSFDTTVRIWDVVSGAETGRMEIESGGPVLSVSFSPDGKSVISATSGNHHVIMWDLARIAEMGKLRRFILNKKFSASYTRWKNGNAIQIHTSANSVSFSPDGKSVVTGSEDKTVRIWDVASGKETKRMEGHSGSVVSVSFSPDGKCVVSGSEDKTIRIWKVTSGAEIGNMEGHSGWLSSVAFSPDGKSVISGSVDKTIRIWDVASGAAETGT